MLFTADLPDALVAKALMLAHRETLSAWTRAVQIHPCPTEALQGIVAATLEAANLGRPRVVAAPVFPNCRETRSPVLC